MLAVAYVLVFLGMLILPIVFGIWLVRRYRLSWKLLLAGALTFIAAQVLHIPLVVWLTNAFADGTLPAIPPNWSLLFNAVVLGLLAGIFEETARWILFKYILKTARTWEHGLVVGAGHGGIEAVLLGLGTAVAFFNMLAFSQMGASAFANLPAEQLELLAQQAAAFWSAPVYLVFLGLAERVFAVSLHLSLSVMVLYSIAARKPLWFWLAILWHALVDAVAVFFGPQFGPLAVEGIMALMAAISLWIMFSLRRHYPPAQPVNREP
jgi:uncharacterized membrane protein YhfC